MADQLINQMMMKTGKPHFTFWLRMGIGQEGEERKVKGVGVWGGGGRVAHQSSLIYQSHIYIVMYIHTEAERQFSSILQSLVTVCGQYICIYIQ